MKVHTITCFLLLPKNHHEDMRLILDSNQISYLYLEQNGVSKHKITYIKEIWEGLWEYWLI